MGLLLNGSFFEGSQWFYVLGLPYKEFIGDPQLSSEISLASTLCSSGGRCHFFGEDKRNVVFGKDS